MSSSPARWGEGARRMFLLGKIARRQEARAKRLLRDIRHRSTYIPGPDEAIRNYPMPIDEERWLRTCIEAIAASPCSICQKPLGYGVRYYGDPTEGTAAHAWCYWAGALGHE